MHVTPNKEKFCDLAKRGNVIPVYTDLTADIETPVSAYAKLKSGGPAFLLESIEGGENVSRYSFIGCRPRKIFACGETETCITTTGEGVKTIPTPDDPLSLIEEEMAPYRPVKLPNLPRFMGGAVGFLAYEYISRVEPTVPKAKEAPLATPLLYFVFVDSVVIFDRVRQTLRLCVNVHLNDTDSIEDSYDEALKELESLRQCLEGNNNLSSSPLIDPDSVQVPSGNFTQPEFEEMVEKAKEYIRAGDIIQVVLSQRFEQSFQKPPIDLYRALRTVNPSPYMFLLETEDFALVGASPEVHVRLTDGLVEIRPIAGTRKRGTTPAEDLALEKDLLADEKEKAEHLMLVDLARNDIGRVCQYGTIEVPEYMTIERYSHVMHIVSQVEGKITKDKNAFDLIRATFPAGTVSGAQKVRAMQIISEFEPIQRGFYAGVLCIFSYDGNLDSCITLRTALVKDGTVYIQSGAGLVADSVPANEFEETLIKASALFKAVNLADSI